MRTVFLLLIAVVMSGCGSGSDAGKVFVPASGHPPNWVNPLFIGRGDFHGTHIKQVGEGPEGGVLFNIHCAACHGSDAEGKIGPSIRGVTADLINFAISTFPIMRGHAILRPDDRQAIAVYLETPGESLPTVGVVIDTTLCNECHGSDLDGGIARVSCFACHKGPDGSLGHPAGWQSGANDPVHFHGDYAALFVIACTNCHGVDLMGGKGPACSKCHDGMTAPILEPFSLNNAEA